MELIKELLLEAKKRKKVKVQKKHVRAVYRRDYLKTKHKKYRKYQKRKHVKEGFLPSRDPNRPTYDIDPPAIYKELERRGMPHKWSLSFPLELDAYALNRENSLDNRLHALWVLNTLVMRNDPSREYTIDDLKKLENMPRKRQSSAWKLDVTNLNARLGKGGGMTENLDAQDVQKASTMLGPRDDTDTNLRHDLHLIRLIKYETKPSEMEVYRPAETRYAMRFFYNVGRAKEVFTKFNGMFGKPVSRSHEGGEIGAAFFDTLTKTRVTLSYNPQEKYLVSRFLLKTNKTKNPEVREYYIMQLANFAKLLLEDKLDEIGLSATLGDPLDQKARPILNDPLTSEIVYLRDMLVKHLRANDDEWKFISDGKDINEARMRVLVVIEQMAASARLRLSTATKNKVAEEVARDYWQKDL